MFGIGMLELIVILVLATIVVGPEKMIEFAGELGRWLAKFRAETSGITREFRDAFDVELKDIRGELNEFQRDLDGIKDLGETLSDPLETGQSTARSATAQRGRPAYNLPTGAGAGDAMAKFQATRQERQQQTLQEQQQRQTQGRPTAPETDPVELSPEPESITEVPTPEIVRDLSPDAEAIEISVGELVGEDDELEPMVLDGPELMEDPFASDEAKKDNGSTGSEGSAGPAEYDSEAEPVEVSSGTRAEDGKEEK
jgi:sec-independent protein translocase protein TatB